MANDTIRSDVDVIRVVPLSLPDGLTSPISGTPAAPPPQLTYRGGPLLTAVEVFTVFWGAEWQQAPQSTLMDSVNAFFDFILTSALLDQLAEYSVNSLPIGHGRRTGTAVVTSPAPRQAVSDAGMQRLLQSQINSSPNFPRPTPNTLYFIYLPPGVSLSQGGGRSCMTFCGYHNDIAGRILYAAMPFPGCAGCTGGLSTLDAITSTSSHELCEAITDAVPGQGWYDDNHGEIGDICAWKTKKVGQYTVQLEWSNKQGACI